MNLTQEGENKFISKSQWMRMDAPALKVQLNCHPVRNRTKQRIVTRLQILLGVTGIAQVLLQELSENTHHCDWPVYCIHSFIFNQASSIVAK